MNRLGVINVFDPRTGFATHPIASVAWNRDRPLHIEWVPLDDDAQQMQHVTFAAMTPRQQVRWLEHHIAEPTRTRAVDLVDDEITNDTVGRRVESLMSDVIRLHLRWP